MTQHHNHHSFATHLDREWASLRHHRRTLRAVASWATQVPPHLAHHFGAIDDLDELLVATHRAAGPGGNELLGALVERSRHDPIAGRIIVQRLLGGLITMSRRYWFLCDHDDPVAEIVGAAWEAISRFDVHTRRGPLAPSLISDAVDQTFRRHTRRRTLDVELAQPADFDDVPSTTAPHPLDELGAVISAARRAGVPTHDLDLLRHLVRAGSPTQVARERKVTTRTIRKHRARAIRCIQDFLAPATA